MSRITCLVLAAVLLAQSPALAAPAAEPYRLGYGDVLGVSSSTSTEPAVAQGMASVAVRPDGRIALPMIGEVAVGGLSPDEVALLLSERYRPFYGSVRFAVNIVKFRPCSVAVLGEVRRGGTFAFERAPTVLAAIAQAGGLDDWALQKEVQIIRDGKAYRHLDLERVWSGAEPDVRLLDQDVVRVPGPWYKPVVQNVPVMSTLAASAVTLGILLLRGR